MGKNDTCLIKMEAIDAWKRAAEENGLKYEAVLEAVGMSNRSIGPARASYAILSKSKGLDPNQDIGVIGITTFQTACRMFGVNADDYIVDIESLKRKTPMTDMEVIEMIQKSEHNLTDVVLSIDSLSNKIEITNQLLRESEMILRTRQTGQRTSSANWIRWQVLAMRLRATQRTSSILRRT